LRVPWTLGAQQDAQTLVAGIALRNPGQAGRLAEELALAAERLSEFRRLGIAAGGNDRYLLVAGGRYRPSYRITEDGLRILGISRGTDPWPTQFG
jgi:plasmid stabilization system protein ParE